MDLVIKESQLKALDRSGDPDYQEAKRLVEEVLKERSTRIRLYIVAAAHRKIEEVERLRDLVDRAEKRVASNIDRMPPDEIVEVMKVMMEMQDRNVRELNNIMELFTKL